MEDDNGVDDTASSVALAIVSVHPLPCCIVKIKGNRARNSSYRMGQYPRTGNGFEYEPMSAAKSWTAIIVS